jgi:RHS repeat-associated protein
LKKFEFVPEASGMLLAESPDVLGEMGVEGLEMPLDGFLYIYVNNESAHDVQFDNLRIRYNPGQLLQVNHYYPYGLPIKELSTQPTLGKPYNDYLMTTKEWNTEFGLNEYDFGARSYDPAIARWYVQDPAEQFYNPYLAIGNNPVVLYDPDGRFIPFAIGAIIGAYMGGVAANGTYDFTNWDSKDTWSYMIGGAVIGGASGFLGGHIASSGGMFANTSAIAAGSFTNSLGMNMWTGGKTDVSMGFGFGAVNLSNGSFGYLGKKGNSTLENIGYGLGALANVADGLAGFKPSNVELQTENLSNPTDGKDKVGHSQLNKNGEVLIDFGPTGDWKRFEPGRNDWIRHSSRGKYELISEMPGNKFSPINVQGVNIDRLYKISSKMNSNPGTYQVLTRSCSSTVSRALTMSGAPAIGIHPYILHAQMYLRSIGVRPMIFSHHLYGY